MAKMSVDDKLGLDKFHVDETNSHIDADQDYADPDEIRKLLLGCPAHLYEVTPEGKFIFSYEGCLECGTCRVLSGGKVVRSWNHPEGGLGIEYRMS